MTSPLIEYELIKFTTQAMRDVSSRMMTVDSLYLCVCVCVSLSHLPSVDERWYASHGLEQIVAAMNEESRA